MNDDSCNRLRLIWTDPEYFVTKLRQKMQIYVHPVNHYSHFYFTFPSHMRNTYFSSLYQHSRINEMRYLRKNWRVEFFSDFNCDRCQTNVNFVQLKLKKKIRKSSHLENWSSVISGHAWDYYQRNQFGVKTRSRASSTCTAPEQATTSTLVIITSEINSEESNKPCQLHVHRTGVNHYQFAS
jgi:hypothetical protein